MLQNVYHNPLTQRIGIWYTKEDEAMMLHIMNHLKKWFGDNVETCIDSKFNNSIYLKNGSWVKTFPITDGMRGQRLTDSFVINPEKVDKEMIDSIIRPITTTGRGAVCKLDTDDPEELWSELYYRNFI